MVPSFPTQPIVVYQHCAWATAQGVFFKRKFGAADVSRLLRSDRAELMVIDHATLVSLSSPLVQMREITLAGLLCARAVSLGARVRCAKHER